MALHGAAAELSLQAFAENYGAKYTRPVDCLLRATSAGISCQRWVNSRTTNPIHSATWDGSDEAMVVGTQTARLVLLNLTNAASKAWRRFKGTNQLPNVIAVSHLSPHQGHYRPSKATPSDRLRHQI